jgi:small ubiquitin-related modifier
MEETKPKLEAGSDSVISIKVKDQSGGEIVFKIKPSTKFGRVWDAYCQKKAWDVGQVRFVFDGERLKPEQTPEEIGMEDGDVSLLLIKFQ